MSSLYDEIAGLSPEERRLFELLLREEGGDPSAVILPRGAEEAGWPLSFAQQRLWFLDQLQPGSPFYNIPMALRLSGALDVSVLEQSLGEVIRRHEALRTCFPARDGAARQVIAPAAPMTIPVTELQGRSLAARRQQARQIAQHEARQPFTLSTGPLLRARLLRIGRREHLLVLAVHHIAADVWSLGLLLTEITSLYAAGITGTPAQLPALPLQYADFAVWQRRWLEEGEKTRQLAYWRQHLDGAPPLLDLPTDRPRPRVQTFTGAEEPVVVPPGTAAALGALSRDEGVTLYVTLLAAFTALLARYTRSTDIVVGTPVANRGRQELEPLIGFFANTLVLRTDLSGRPSFRALARRVREATLGALAHQDLPFDQLVEELQPRRAPGHSPLFQVMFVFQNAPPGRLALPGLTLSPVPVDSGTVHFDLTLRLWEATRGIEGRFEYNTGLFDASTIRRLARHFQRLLAGVAANPDAPIASLPLLTAAETRRVLREWNSSATRPRAAACVDELFATQVARTPDAYAVIAGQERVTYAMLAARAHRLAHHLVQQFQAAPEARVAVCADRGVDLVVAALAVWMADAVYVPLDPAYPLERLTHVLTDTQPVVVICDAANAARVAESRGDLAIPVLSLEAQAAAIARQPARRPARRNRPENAAYIIYTSGSTGTPHGVVATQAALAHYARTMGMMCGLTPRDRYLHTASFGFSSSIRQLMVPLTTGAAVVIAGAADITDPRALFQLIAACGVTVADWVPSYWRRCVETLDALPISSQIARPERTLRLVLSASEPLPVDLPGAWAAVSGPRGGADAINMFGQTETTGIAAMYRIPPGDAPAAGPLVPIGRPIANVRVYVLDASLLPVPAGVTGDVYISGPTLARGYRLQPALTAERFIPHPFGWPGARLYRTGDLGRHHADGTIEFVGRADHQVKIRGVRVELGEIDAQLVRHPAISEAVTVLQEARDGDDGERRLVAYVVPTHAPAPAPEPRELRAFLQTRLPAYMVPARFVVLEALPRTATNKIDRRALPPAPRERPSGGAGAADAGAGGVRAPRTPTEELLVAIWRETLRLEEVSRDDDFFECGGHSLMSTQVVSRIRDAFRIELPMRVLFDAPTIAALAPVVDAACAAARGVVRPPLTPVARQPHMPASFAQQRLWLLQEFDPANAVAYIVPSAVRLQGPLDAAALAQALNDVVRRHETLRTTFRAVDGQPVVCIQPALTLRVPVTDLQTLPEAQREEAARRDAAEESRLPFDLQQGPLIRLRLLRLAPEDHLLTVTCHHIISDGWSMGILIRELTAAYAARAAGADASILADLPLQYADVASWQRAWLQGETLERHLAYWRTRLADAEPVLALPVDYPRPAKPTLRGAQQSFLLDKALADRVNAVGRRYGATLFMTLVAAFQTLLGRYAGQQDVSIGTPVAGRTRSEVEGLIGCFVNTLVLRADLRGNPRFCDLLAQVRQTTLGAYAHQEMPFERLIEELQPERGLSHAPLFQVVFVLQNAPRPPMASPGLRVQQMELHNQTAKFDMTLGLTETTQGLWGALEYSTDLFSAATIDRFCRHFERLLAGMASNPEQRIGDIALMDESERRELLAAGEGPLTAYPERPIHELFAAQAARTPEATAVADDTGRLTYRELHDRARLLARELRRRGVGPDVVVGVLMERSTAVVVALLGILEAGGAYLPLDPAYPLARLQFMVQDAGASIVLTQQALVSGLPELAATLLAVDTAWPALEQAEAAYEPPRVSIDHLAYVTYTSGSTGRPKGVAIPHRGAVRLLCPPDYAELGPDTSGITLVPLPFDVSTLDIWGPLLHGGRVALFAGRVPTAQDLGEFLTRHGVTTMWLTGSLFNAMIEDAPQVLRGLRQLLIGGEALSVPYVRRALQALPETRIINGYGPTENTTFTTCHTIARPLPERLASIPIGRPIAHTQVRLLDERMQLVPRGVMGELYTGGDGLARGYRNRPALTAERFLPDPLGGGGRLYRTGDLARWLPDGTLEYLGRRDHQVKVRGVRIELGEIETVLGSHPAVRDVAVILHTAPAAGQRLVAYVVLRPTPETTVEDLRRYAQARLPEHMTPSVIMLLEKLPLTPNQKIDRAALPPPDLTTRVQAPFEAPRTEEERALAALWQELLGRDAVSIHENFFDLGGHSLLASQLVSRAGMHLHVRLPLRAVFEAPTIAGLAKHVEVLRWVSTAHDPAPGGAADDEEEAAI